MDEYTQIFKRTTRKSRYRKRLLVEEFKRGMNGWIRRRLIKAKYSFKSINKWYNKVARL